MRYFGSKASTVPSVYQLVVERVRNGSLCDPFGGTATVGSHFKSRGWEVWCGDVLLAAHFFQVARVELDALPDFGRLLPRIGLHSTDDLLALLNGVQTESGWLVEEFSRKRPCFTIQNARRIEACRRLITSWAGSGWLRRDERALLLASLVEGMDKVANTAGTYYSYLKTWHRKALNPFWFEFIPVTTGKQPCRAFIGDALSLVSRRRFDVLYLDPPHNGRNYARYYHLPESIANCTTPPSARKSGVPAGTRPPSDYGTQTRGLVALRKLLEAADFGLLVLHYSDAGVWTHTDVVSLLGHFGPVEEVSVTGLGYTTSSRPRAAVDRVYVVQHG